MCRSSGGFGTWKIEKEEDYDYWMKQINKEMPYAETILTEMVQNVDQQLGCHLYLNRKGEVTWLAVTEMIIDDDGTWIGAVMRVCMNIHVFHADSYFEAVGQFPQTSVLPPTPKKASAIWM